MSVGFGLRLFTSLEYLTDRKIKALLTAIRRTSEGLAGSAGSTGLLTGVTVPL